MRKYIYYGFLFLMGCVGFYTAFIADDKCNETLYKEYPLLKREDSLSGRIDTFFWYQQSIPKGALFIKLKTGNKFEAFVSSSSEETKSSLYDFLEKDDFVTKPSGKDSIYVLKNKLRYSFLLPTQEYNDSVFHKE